MKRITDYYLSIWKDESDRKPLLLRGARQIGKTFSVRKFGKLFDSFVEVNFELLPRAIGLF
jgi:predicted AAA+ superfamily ATPase